jgi:hypothetical protein
MVLRDLRTEEWGMTASEYRVSSSGEENVLKLDTGITAQCSDTTK